MTKDKDDVWERVKKTVKPYKKTKKTVSKKENMTEMKSGEKQTFFKDKHRKKTALISPPMDSATIKKIEKEIIKIDSKLDLHGMTQEVAYKTLLNFIKRCFNQKKRWVLVITGKGSGVLQENVPKWLKTKTFSVYVRHVEQAVPKHGGAGALYICIKK